MKENADDVPVVEFTVRAPCKACGRLYVWPKGSKAPGGIGPCCQPTLDGTLEPPPAPEPADVEVFDDEDVPSAPPRDLGHLGLEGVLCSGCRYRDAVGRLYPPGVPVCDFCADEAIEHWVAWSEDPSHDWWPSDDPFGSARHPIEGWRDVIRV